MKLLIIGATGYVSITRKVITVDGKKYKSVNYSYSDRIVTAKIEHYHD